MARTRAERRANTARKCKARLKKSTHTPGFSPICGGCVTPSGEAKSCPLCEAEKRYQWNIIDKAIQDKKKDDSWWKSQLDTSLDFFY